jgi:hypothetical protein
LPHIHMIVGMNFLAAAIFSDQFEGAIRNHLVGVHISEVPDPV